MSNTKPESKTDAIIKLVLVFFVCLLSFSVGTFVGKKFSDNQHRMAKYEPSESESEDEALARTETADRDVASVSPESLQVKPESQDELMKLAESFQKEGVVANRVKPTEKIGSGSISEPSDTPEVKLGPPADPAEAVLSKLDMKPLDPLQRIANKLPPEPQIVEPPQDSRIPTSLPRELASSPVGKFTVQVGAFPNEEEAKKKSAELKAKGFPSFYIKAQVREPASSKSRTWFRVSVGLFASPKEADALKKELLQQAQVSSALVQKISE